MNTLEQELTEYYLDANHGNRVIVHDFEALCGMIQRGILPRSVILGEGPEAEDHGRIISSLEPSIPVYHAPEEETAEFLSSQTGFRIRPYALSAFVEVPVLPFTEETLLRFRRVVILNHSIYLHNIAMVIDLCTWFGIDALILFETAKSPFLSQISLQTDFRNLEIPVIMAPDDPGEYITPLRSCGFTVIATALRRETLVPEDLRRFGDTRTALLFGNEPNGLPDEDIDLCDCVVKIPMREGIDSLNVAQACSILLYELTADDPDRRSRN